MQLFQLSQLIYVPHFCTLWEPIQSYNSQKQKKILDADL